MGEGPERGASEVGLARVERGARCFSGEGVRTFLINSDGRKAAWGARFCLISVDLRKLENSPFHHCGSAVFEGSRESCSVDIGSVVIFTGIVSEG